MLIAQMKIIAFGHKRFVGKDTAANLLATHLRSTKKNISVKKIGFASKLKEMAYSIYGYAGLKDEEYYELNHLEKEEILPKLGKSPRTIWIEMGSKLREIHDDTWLAYIFNGGIRVNYLILKDLRYINEAENVLARGGYCIKVENPNAPVHDDIADNALNFFDKWTTKLTNDGDIKQLNERIISLAGKLDL